MDSRVERLANQKAGSPNPAGKQREAAAAAAAETERLAELANEVCSWLDEFEQGKDGGGRREMERAIRELLVRNWDPAVVDASFAASKTRSEALASLIESPFWRQAIYQLSEEHPDCDFLKHAIELVHQSGYQKEIVATTQGSNYVDVFRNFLVETLLETRNADDRPKALAELVNLCGQHEHTYLYTQIFLYRLMQKRNGFIVRQIVRQLESATMDNYGRPMLVPMMRLLLAGVSGELANALAHIVRERVVAAGDFMTIYEAYCGPRPPPPDLLQDCAILNTLIGDIYVPNQNQFKQANKDKYIWLLAYAACGQRADRDKEASTGAENLHQRTIAALENLESILKKVEAAFGLDQLDLLAINGVEVVQCIKYPIAGMAFLTWIMHMVTQTNYLESIYKLQETPFFLVLLDEIAERHPLQQESVFQILRKLIEKKYESTISADALAKFKRTLARQMVTLAQLGHAVPVVSFMSQLTGDVVLHWLETILEIVRPPFEKQFLLAFMSALDKLLERGVLAGSKRAELRKKVEMFCDQHRPQPSTVD